MIVSRLLIEFILFSFLGWVWESLFDTFRKHQWDNRGFLFGPICPIYGSSVVLGDLLFQGIATHTGQNPADLPVWQVFLVGMVGSAVMEYLTSYVMEKRFHARWWDYSKLPLNLNGRISLPTSAGFGAAGVLIVRYALPLYSRLDAAVSDNLAVLISLILTALLSADFALTETNLNDLLKQIQDAEAEFNSHMESRYKRLESSGMRLREGREAVQQRIKDAEEIRLSQSSLAKLDGARRRYMHQLHSIQGFRTEGHTRIAGQMRDYLEQAREQRKADRKSKH